MAVFMCMEDGGRSGAVRLAAWESEASVLKKKSLQRACRETLLQRCCLARKCTLAAAAAADCAAALASGVGCRVLIACRRAAAALVGPLALERLGAVHGPAVPIALPPLVRCCRLCCRCEQLRRDGGRQGGVRWGGVGISAECMQQSLEAMSAHEPHTCSGPPNHPHKGRRSHKPAASLLFPPGSPPPTACSGFGSPPGCSPPAAPWSAAPAGIGDQQKQGRYWARCNARCSIAELRERQVYQQRMQPQPGRQAGGQARRTLYRPRKVLRMKAGKSSSAVKQACRRAMAVSSAGS